MRIYEGSPRRDFEEVLRSIGAFLDQRGMREVLLAEAPDGFIVQGLVVAGGAGAWTDASSLTKETLTFLDEDIARFMEEAIARRGSGIPRPEPTNGTYERSFRVLGRYLDGQKPQDVFFFEQEGAFVVRLLMNEPGTTRHVLAEFTRDDIEAMVVAGPSLREAADAAASARAGS